MLYRIIVGVKYCFRYNQRNRRPQHDDNGEPIDMVAMPHGPRRRRREKKLMTMDEVNERFPLLKYKAWMTNRAEEGLPTAGGVAVPSASRAASIRNAEGTLERKSGETQRPITPATKESIEQPGQSPESKKEATPRRSTEEPAATETQNRAAESEHQDTGTSLAPQKTNDTADDLDDDDQIQMAVPSEMMATPGDSCAICIDTLEDDDDVRGLTCGHAFHAGCLDPWLTSRRACCPLCKADYYVPKPRPEGEATADGDRSSGRRPHGQRGDLPQTPQDAFLGNAQRRPRFLPARFMMLTYGGNGRAGNTTNNQPNRNRARPSRTGTSPNHQNGQQETPRRLVPRFSVPRPNLRLPAFMRRNQQTPQPPPTSNDAPTEASPSQITTTTPGQLEAGQRQG